jgi:class 3 adenylate cyclase
MRCGVVWCAVGVACVEFRSRVRANNAKLALTAPSASAALDRFYKLNGIGCHFGPLTLVPGTDVHWGDCVNTAAKLADDVCKGEQMMITETVHQLLMQADAPYLHTLNLKPMTFMRSGAELKVRGPAGLSLTLFACHSHLALSLSLSSVRFRSASK